uniref:Uncharacterized protein n=1 Tax=Cajanus cajan TaxID=3821 RepID=A0A151T0A3_CAJCA|nr:hypothetical protein KK1_022898 [Cajanus cajan]
MLRAGVKPDECTYPFVLKECSDFGEVHKGREVHGVVFKFGFDGDVFVGNTLLAFYGNCGLFSDAMKVFDEMPERDKVSWNTIIGLWSLHGFYKEALGSFRAMVAAVPEIQPDLVTVVSHVKVGNALVDVYGKCGSEKASKKVFDEIDERNVVSWNSIITSFSFRGKYMDALDVFRLMIGTGMRPNSVTISSMLPVLGELGLFKWGMEIHGFSLRMAIESDIFIANSLIDIYAKSGSSRIASIIFNKMEGRSIVSWNAMIANFAQNRLEFEAVELVRQMQAKGETPNNVTFTNVLPACYSRTNDCSESISLFSEMILLGMLPDIVSFMGVISACANLASIRQGKEVHGLLMRKLFHTHLFVANSLLDLYTRCGRIDLATKVFDRIQNKDVASWNTMILGYGMLGELETAINLFEAMKEDGVEYDSVSFIAVLSACSHGGLIEKGRKYFKMMHDLNIEPAHTHYACMVDLLGRAGLMREAADLIRGLSIVPDTNIWGALLGACRIHGNIELGHWAAEHLFKLKPQHSGYYILLSNMYAEAERWDEANKVRELMKSRGAKKNPGCSWVQTGDQVHAFLVGEKIDSLDDDFWKSYIC